MSALMERIGRREAVVGIIGLGYVGLPLAIAFRRAGFPVIGFDIDPAKIKTLTAGRSYFKHIGDEQIAAMQPGAGFAATTDFARIHEADALVICVPTPLGKRHTPDLSFIVRTAETMVSHLRPGQLVSLESTTYPGTTRDVLKPILEKSGLAVGRDLFLAFSPEREDPGNAQFTTRTIPKIVAGYDDASLAAASALYGACVERVVPVSSLEVAEATKLTENIYRAVNIALVNELKVIYERMGIDVWEVLEAAATKPFGFGSKANKTFCTPGPGLGGHCIPIDPFYLTWKARAYGLATRFIEWAGEINTSMPDYVLRRLAKALKERGRKVRGARVLVLGIAYKPDVEDLRESPAIVLIEELRHAGARVAYHDPYIPHTRRQREHDLKMHSVELTEKALAAQDAVLIVTNHSSYDYAWIVAHARLVVDTRNACCEVKRGREKIVKA